ncbi:plasmid partitioning protein RepB [Salipiger sp. 1_MG-2023]|uniref:plasmid partitioning protein RepB n=1 Tax=Salipiger sp. 1_MG-2023 TaxID=3062665 RepID=UPI0026E1732B|nr:plasmid partitioning protein RepB [Salipiger sp. 1_MG-2023]MDO6587500.1 plasmid partitioning protein RepB [Salipiger sp. 1_MG-2023]
MKRDLLAKSLAQMGSRDTLEAPVPGAAPKSLRSMSDVLSQVSAQAPQDIDPAEIADSDIADRFDVAQGLDDLVASIRASGQQLPALLRFRRGAGPRYEVVYGRRRIAACRVLGIKVRAYIREMDHREALISQALENSARLERSFIEQAIFAVRLEEQGFSRADIGDVLAVDKGTLSKLIGVARDVPDAVIYAIGAAHDAGRRPWLELRRLLKLDDAPDEAALLAMIPDVASPTDRLSGLIRVLAKQDGRRPPAPALPPAAPVRSTARGNRLTIEVSGQSDTGFIGFVEARLAALYQNWKSGKG